MKSIRLILAAAAALLLIAAWLMTVSVPEGSLAVAGSSESGGASRVLQAGYHIVAPGTRLTYYSLAPATISGEVLVTPPSGGEVPMRYAASGRIDPGRAGELARAMGPASFESFLSSQAGALLTRTTSGVDAVELLTPGFRSRSGEAIAGVLTQAGVLEAKVTVKPPDDLTLLAAAQYLIQTREAWKIRMTVAEALLEPGRSRSWQLLTAMGLVNESERLLKDAETNYLDALAAEPAALPPMSQLVAIYSTVGELDKLRRILDAALSVQPKSVQHLNWAAMVLMKQDQRQPAERLLRDAMAIDPANPTIQANLAGLLLKDGRLEEAISMLRALVSSTPENSQALFNLGSALAASGKPAEALEWLEKVEAAGPASPALVRTLMTVHQELGHAARAGEYRERLRALEAEAASRRKPERRSRPG